MAWRSGHRDRWRSTSRRAVRPVLVVCCYLAAWSGLDMVARHFESAPGVSVWYPPPALDLVLLLLFGLRYAPALALNGVLHTLVISDVGLGPLRVTAYVVVTTAGYTAAAAVLRRVVRIDLRLAGQRDMVWFVAVACVAGPLVVAVVQVGLLTTAGVVEPRESVVSAAGNWAGTATGVGMLAPLLLVLSRRWTRRWAGAPPVPPDLPGLRVRTAERAAQYVVLAVTVAVAYGPRVGGGTLDYTYLVYVPLIWVAVRGGIVPAVVAVLLVDVGAALANGGRVPGQGGGIALQFGLVTLTLVGLLLGALITQRRVDAEAHRHAALHDPLTGLANRALFTDRLAHAVSRADRHPDARFAVLFLDLDRFKTVNDSLGHAAGDALLVEVGARLRAVTRPADSVARFGGDEFAILVEDLTDPAELTSVAGRVLAALSAPHDIGEARVTVTGSVGSVLSRPTDHGHGPGDRLEDLLRDADVALHRAKVEGRSRHVRFDRAMHTQAVAGLRQENALRAALDGDGITLVFQPVHALSDRRLVALEALARWTMPDGRPVPPATFVALAEETGLIGVLGRRVLERACAVAATWPPSPGPTPAGWSGDSAPPRVAVNVSAAELRHPGYARQVLQVLADTGLPAGRLELEITESLCMDPATTVTRALDELADAGVALLIDDFGTGYSSFGYLQRMPMTGLKIDRSFVTGLPRRRDQASIVKAMLAMAAELRLEVTAEGVETPEQLDFLARHHCSRAQGYLLGRPAVTVPPWPTASPPSPPAP